MWSSTRSCAAESRRLVAGTAVVLALALAGGARAADEPVPDYVHTHFVAHFAGEARLTWFGLHVYDARLFVPPGFDVVDAVAQPFALELTYARALEGKAIAQTSRDEMARLGFGTEEKRRRWFEAMLRVFPDVERGRRIAGVNLPARGVRFYVDGRDAGSIDDIEFARAFFAIWLDPRTRSPKVRDGLLRGLARN